MVSRAFFVATPATVATLPPPAATGEDSSGGESVSLSLDPEAAVDEEACL